VCEREVLSEEEITKDIEKKTELSSAEIFLEIILILSQKSQFFQPCEVEHLALRMSPNTIQPLLTIRVSQVFKIKMSFLKHDFEA
jgi:hypothetical protein